MVITPTHDQVDQSAVDERIFDPEADLRDFEDYLAQFYWSHCARTRLRL